jgi:hypothetical protein
MFTIEHPPASVLRHDLVVMKNNFNSNQALAVRCPICGAPPGVRCELSTGLPRTEPHRERRLTARDSSDTGCTAEQVG